MDVSFEIQILYIGAKEKRKMNDVVIGMAGAGRGTELHIGGYKRVHGVDIRLKHIIARRPEQLNAAKERYGFEEASLDFDDLINDPDINVIDICTPPYTHVEMIEKALNAGKHVICEKPLSGYFGRDGDATPIGNNVSKKAMFEWLMADIERLKTVVEASNRKFMYAENFVYAPSIQRAAEIITAKMSRILYMKGEESLKGSSSAVAGEWNKTGGGTFIRTGSHPLSAILWLKQVEAKAHGEQVSMQSVIADMGRITPSLSDYEHRHIAAKPNDVEDCSVLNLSFTDGTKATIIATDILLGGSKNYVELYCNDTAINCNLTLSDLMETYLIDEDGMDKVTLSEMLPIKTGWNKPFVVDEIIRGYADEMQDFAECIALDREPKSGFKLAYDTIKAIYAAYYSAEEGKRVTF